MSIRAALKSAIEASDKSLYQLAKEAEISPIQLTRFLRGERDLRLAPPTKWPTCWGSHSAEIRAARLFALELEPNPGRLLLGERAALAVKQLAQRDGAHTADPASNSVKRMPSAADRSMLGVLIFCWPD